MNFEQELNKEFNKKIKAMQSVESDKFKFFNHSLKWQQKLTLVELKKSNAFINYSETGAGKTKAVIACAKELDLKHTLVLCPNNVKNTWHFQINEATFVDENFVSIDKLINKYSDDDFTFEIFNYDKFNGAGNVDKRINNILNSKVYHLIALDEAHHLKNNGSNTYKNVTKLIQQIKKINPKVKIIGLTATPETTNVEDVKNIYEILTGKKADELTVGSLPTKLLNANLALESVGFGYFPESKMEVRYNGISSKILFSKNNYKKIFDTELANIDGSSIEKECIKNKGNVSKIERIHMMLKFDAYKHLIKKGTVIYTEYTYGDKILNELRDLVKQLGFSVGIYSGNNKAAENSKYLDSIEEFIDGQKDVLIVTKSLCEGTDGLQKVSNRLILHSIPTVWAIAHQLVGRFDREMNSNFVEDGVDVYVPMVVFKLNDGSTTSFDKKKWLMCMYRKKIDECIKKGIATQIELPDIKTLSNEVVNKLKNKWELVDYDREDVPEIPFEFKPSNKKAIKNFISDFNAIGKITGHKKFHEKVLQNPKDLIKYHKARDLNMKEWPEIPYEYIAKQIKNKNRVVADFGCGMNRMKDLIPDNKVYGFDHYKLEENVIACDMANTGFDDESIDIAVFSLSLWGEYEDYFKEAYRMLNYDGLIYIAEASKSYDETKRNELIEMLKTIGFTYVSLEDRGKFFYLKMVK